jgi:hypothetical protein
MPRSLPQEPVHSRGTIRAAPAQCGIGELSQYRATGGAETNSLSIDLAQEIVRHRHHNLGHIMSIPWYTMEQITSDRLRAVYFELHEDVHWGCAG